MAEAMILDTEAAVMANFEFLGPTDVDMEDDDDMSDELDEGADDEHDEVKAAKRKAKVPESLCTPGAPLGASAASWLTGSLANLILAFITAGYISSNT